MISHVNNTNRTDCSNSDYTSNHLGVDTWRCHSPIYDTQLDKIRFAPQLPDYYLHRKRSLIAETTPKKNYGYQAIISWGYQPHICSFKREQIMLTLKKSLTAIPATMLANPSLARQLDSNWRPILALPNSRKVGDRLISAKLLQSSEGLEAR